MRATRTTRANLLAGACVLVLSAVGCMVGPDYKPPVTSDVPAAWSGPLPPVQASTAVPPQDIGTWWTTFNDPILTSLIDRAVKSNLDVKLAESRINQSRAARALAISGIGPSADATAGIKRGQNGTAPATTQYQAGFDASWEIDIFGGTRRSIEASQAELNANVENRRDALVSVTAETAVDYVQLRSLQQQILIARKNLVIQKQSADVTQKKFEGGFVGALDVENAKAQVATTTAQIPQLEAGASQMIYSLSILLGEPPGALVEELSPTSQIPAAPPAVPVGVPSELLKRRPDIRSAEDNFHAATAQIGVATADLYPKVTLSGLLNWQSINSGSLFDASSRAWSWGPSVTLPLFRSGQIRANIEVQKALAEQAFINYRKTVLTAFQEVENALISSQKEQDRHAALAQAVAANRKAVDLATRLYSDGQTDFLNVIQAEGSLNSTENALVQSEANLSTNLIALYKAMGGGWSEDAGESLQKSQSQQQPAMHK